MTPIEKAQKVVDSKVSQYRIHKDTGISQSTIGDLRSGKTKVERMSFKNGMLLAEYYDSMVGKNHENSG